MKRDSTIIKDVMNSYWNEDFRKAIKEGKLTWQTEYWLKTVTEMMKIALFRLRREFALSEQGEQNG